MTLTPFAEAEKPQLSPGLAASLIKNGSRIEMKRLINEDVCTAKKKT
jgi:hypothetical protein